MPGLLTAKPRATLRRAASACLLTLTFATAADIGAASAGPIGDHFREWSARRQAKSQVESPFSKHSSAVDLSQSSTLQKLRSRLTGKSGDVANNHLMKVQYMKHEGGVLQR